MAHRGLVRSSPRFLYSFSVFSYATLVIFCKGFRVHKRLRCEVVSWVPYPGGVGGPMTRPAPYRSCLCLASVFFQGYEKLKVETEIFRKTLATFWGRSGVPPRSSPRGGLGFAEGKAERTSMFVRARALEGREGFQKAISEACFLIILGN